MLDKIPQSRLVLYGLFLGFLPVIFVGVNIWSQVRDIDEISNTIEYVEGMAMSYKKRQAVNLAVRNHYRDADHFYIDKQLEVLSFLEPEVDALEKIINNKNFAGDPNIKKRLEQLTGPTNSLVFTEGVVQSFPLYQETTETLIHPIEVNVDDIQKILTKTEGVDMGPYKVAQNRPQLIVLDFRIDKKSHENENEVFILNMKLLKREYL